MLKKSHVKGSARSKTKKTLLNSEGEQKKIFPPRKARKIPQKCKINRKSFTFRNCKRKIFFRINEKKNKQKQTDNSP